MFFFSVIGAIQMRYDDDDYDDDDDDTYKTTVPGCWTFANVHT